MTKRRLTAAEVEYNEKRASVLSRVDAQYVADAPFVFANRIAVTAALSRIELFSADGEMRFRNPSHPAAGSPALAPSVLSTP